MFCTWGADGAAALQMSDRNTKHVKGFSPNDNRVIEYATYLVLRNIYRELIDDSTIGAGDTFIAGVLFGLIYEEWKSLQQIISFANKLAAYKVSQVGFSDLAKKMNQSLYIL